MQLSSRNIVAMHEMAKNGLYALKYLKKKKLEKKNYLPLNVYYLHEPRQPEDRLQLLEILVPVS